MPSYGKDWADFQANYSFSNRNSIGISNFYREGEKSSANFVIGQFNHLIKRWNELESQANIYASAGLGGRHDSVHDGAGAAYGALEADWETRRIYTLLGGEALLSPGGENYNRVRGRLGFAPYKAGFEALNTWVVLQFDYMPRMENEFRITPLLRFFYNNFALEAGSSLKGEPYFGAMAHF